MKGESFLRKEHIRKHSEFIEIYENGETVRKNAMKFYFMSSSNDFGRLGITVPRKTGNAVIRNRYRRWIREIFRCNKSYLKNSVDLVVCVFRDQWADFKSFDKDFLYLFKKIDLI